MKYKQKEVTKSIMNGKYIDTLYFCLQEKSPFKIFYKINNIFILDGLQNTLTLEKVLDNI